MIRRGARTSVLTLLMVLLVACGPSARTQTLRVNLVALNAARDTLLVVSKEREAQIVALASSKEEGRKQLEAWRVVVDKAATAIEIGYHAIDAAAILDDARSVETAVTATTRAIALLRDLKEPQEPQP